MTISTFLVRLPRLVWQEVLKKAGGGWSEQDGSRGTLAAGGTLVAAAWAGSCCSDLSASTMDAIRLRRLALTQ